MKRIAALIAVLLLLLTSCGGNAELYRQSVSDAAEQTNLLTRFEADFFLEVTFDDSKATLLYRNGSFGIDREAKRLFSVDSQTLLGTSVKVTTFCDGKTVYREAGQNKTASKLEEADVFSVLPYFPMPVFKAEDMLDVEPRTVDDGTQYVFSVKNAKDFILAASAGDEIYTLAMLNKPQKDKTEFGNLNCSYTVGTLGGRECVTSQLYSFDMTLYDTPPYAAGADIDPEDYKLELNFRIRIKIRSIPDSVELPDFDPKDYKSTKVD